MKVLRLLCAFLLVFGILSVPSRTKNVGSFLVSFGMSEYEELFRSEDITMDILVHTANDDDDLKSIGVRTFGQWFRILHPARECFVTHLT